MTLQVETNKLIALAITFILFVVIGTLSHEYGHILVAKKLGYKTTLHYGSMNYNSELLDRLTEIYSKNEEAINDKIDFKERVEYEEGSKKANFHHLLIALGGPIQTILTGLIGLIILAIRKEKIKQSGVKIIDWLGIFLALFWLRKVFNLTVSIGTEIINPNGSYFSGDEKKVSEFLALPSGTFSIVLGAIGLLITLWIVCKIIPRELRFTFILSGFIGGISGFILWMHLIGPQLLP